MATLITIVIIASLQYTTSSLPPTNCTAIPGFSCSSLIILENGELSAILVQSTGHTIYDISAACIASSEFLQRNITPLAFAPISGNNSSIADDQIVYIKNLTCSNVNGNALGIEPEGLTLNVSIFLKYRENSTENTYRTVEIATAVTKVVK